MLAAAIMLPMLPLEVDELIAMGQFMKKKMKKGESFWKVFWEGGTVDGGEKEEHAPELMKFPQEPGKVYTSSIWGMSFPWSLSISALLGAAMVFAPGVVGVPIQDLELNSVKQAIEVIC